MAQFSFNSAAPHLCKYVDVRHWRSEICHGQRPNEAFEPPTIRGSGNIRLPHTAITINVELINGVIILIIIQKLEQFQRKKNWNFTIGISLHPLNTFHAFNSESSAIFNLFRPKFSSRDPFHFLGAWNLDVNLFHGHTNDLNYTPRRNFNISNFNRWQKKTNFCHDRSRAVNRK